LDAIARVAQRLSVLLGAGVSPASAWGYLETEEFGELCARVAAEGETAITDCAELLEEPERSAWLGLGAAWRVATDMGAPIAPSLEQFAVGLRSLADAQRETEVALAGPVATGRLVLALPVVGILFGVILGFNTIGTLFTTLPGLACLGVGMALLLLGRRWTRRLVAAAQPTELLPGLEFELLAIAVSGGGSLDRAVAAVEVALAQRIPLGRHTLRSGGGENNDPRRLIGVEAVLALSARAGVPAGALLRAEAAEARRDARASAQKKAAQLGVQLMIPLGLCVLPAFMALGVAPLLISVISSTIAGM
jgi:tight adherence protein B